MVVAYRAGFVVLLVGIVVFVGSTMGGIFGDMLLISHRGPVVRGLGGMCDAVGWLFDVVMLVRAVDQLVQVPGGTP